MKRKILNAKTKEYPNVKKLVKDDIKKHLKAYEILSKL